ncbi:hypothetical protein CEXT_519921 [Caerostris extrusa]|uniref:Uncharacterized protein n=1 Tax=Caerostris extrusa TaxID=172846 RepID=A0AAV4X6J4_CAEEX|nr:hypothetical protein CEXT_519921 [Caerostris extrusa]
MSRARSSDSLESLRDGRVYAFKTRQLPLALTFLEMSAAEESFRRRGLNLPFLLIPRRVGDSRVHAFKTRKLLLASTFLGLSAAERIFPKAGLNTAFSIGRGDTRK